LIREKSDTLLVPTAFNEVWSMDVMHDQLSDGRSIRLSNIIDDRAGPAKLDSWLSGILASQLMPKGRQQERA